MQDSKAPTLSIGPKKPKVFGKPNQSPMLTLSTQKSSEPANKSPSVTPKKSKTAASPVLTLSMNANSAQKDYNKISDARSSNINDNDYDLDDNSKKSENTTPSKKREITENLSGRSSPHSSISEKDRISLKSASSSKKSSSSFKQRQSRLKENNSKEELQQSPEPVFDEDQKIGSEQPITPVKARNSDIDGKSPSVLSVSSVKKSASSAKKSQPKQISLENSPANSKSSKQPTTPTTPASTNSKMNKKNGVSANKARASTPNKDTQLKANNYNSEQRRSKNGKNQLLGDDSSDYSPANSPKRRSRSPVNNKGGESPTKDIIPIVKSLLDNNNNNDNSKNESNVNAIDESKFNDVSESLDEWQKKIISKASPIEEAQIQLWYDSLIELFKQQNICLAEKSESSTENAEKGGVSQTKISYQDEITSKARELLCNHRFPLHGEYRHRFKFIVTGPNRSGKSTYISIFAQQLLFELIACGDWKRTFIFAIDFANFVHISQDLGNLFVEMARLSIQALCAQRPLLIKYSTLLIEAFTAVVNGKPAVPRMFQLDEDFRLIAPRLQQLLDICYDCYHDSEAMTSFVVNICMLPFFIADIFGGFSNLIILADHFDLIDVTKTASPPFEDSPDNVFIAEIFKYLFIQGSFIIGSKFESALNEVLKSLEVASSTFSQGIEYITTYNIVKKNKNDENEGDSEGELAFNVSFVDNNESFLINEDQFEGCPLYLSKFDEIRDIAKRIEKGQKQEDDKLSASRNENNNENDENDEIDVEEEKLKLIIKMNEILKLTMIQQDGSPYSMNVKDVIITHKSKKQKKTE